MILPCDQEDAILQAEDRAKYYDDYPKTKEEFLEFCAALLKVPPKVEEHYTQCEHCS